MTEEMFLNSTMHGTANESQEVDYLTLNLSKFVYFTVLDRSMILESEGI